MHCQPIRGSEQSPRGKADILCAWDNPTYPSNKDTAYRPMPVSKGSLNQWGWQQDPSSTDLASNTQDALRGAFAALGFPLTGPDITMSTWVQDREGRVTIKGEEIEFSETGARYQNAFSARYGFVVAEYNVSPAEQIKRNRAKVISKVQKAGHIRSLKRPRQSSTPGSLAVHLVLDDGPKLTWRNGVGPWIQETPTPTLGRYVPLMKLCESVRTVHPTSK
ncbi:hypothetical protein KC331_g7842 [Hortaea werneckii]|nr:hypothetical protein KC331_g7842 [Hortaea werneckii]KAI7716905.1 hypothetical protein KC353_g5007 [Hortaea werneckii]